MNICAKIKYGKNFHVGNENYKFIAYLDGDIDIIKVGNYDNPNGVLGDAKNPLRVIRKFLDELGLYVHDKYPPFFAFVAYENKRESLYNRAIDKIEVLTGYKCIEHNNGYYLFYRLPIA